MAHDLTTDDNAPTPVDEEIARARLALLGRRLHRRRFLGGALGATGALLALDRLDALAAPRTASRPLTAAQGLPADAAAPEDQIFIMPADPTLDKTPDFYEAVYERISIAAFDILSDPLVRFNKDFEIVPAAATEWSGSADGKTWTFKIDPNLVWSDGNPVTADDWVTTFQYGADPKHAWDFTWFFDGVLKNWGKAIKGEVPLDQLGVRAADPHTLVFETEVAAPYLPVMLLYSPTLSKAAKEKSGPLYNSKPETSVTAGPLKLVEWTPDQRVVYEKNPDYKGTLAVPVSRVVVKLADPKTWFTMYQNNEIDYLQGPAPADLKLAQADPDMATQIYSSVGDFRTFYLFFDVTKAPFDDLKVRQAFSHVVDRDAIQQQILGPGGKPAYSWLAPGFPAANGDGLKEIQKYDVTLAKQLLAEAGFPDGKDFPKQEFWLRNEDTQDQNVANSIAAAITEQLGIEVEVSNKDSKSFMDTLTAKPTGVLFGYVSYGMDFVDPSNMLSVWLSGGRHSWSNPDFDAKVKEAASFTGDPAKRTTMFQEAEKILVEDVPAIFVYHETPVQLIKPWVKGDALTPDENGLTNMHWPGYTAMSTVPAGIYITKDAPSGREG